MESCLSSQLSLIRQLVLTGPGLAKLWEKMPLHIQMSLGELKNCKLKFSPGRRTCCIWAILLFCYYTHTHTITHLGHEVMALMRFTGLGPHQPLMTGQTGLISRGVLSPSGRLLLHQARQEHRSNGTHRIVAGKTHRSEPSAILKPGSDFVP